MRQVADASLHRRFGAPSRVNRYMADDRGEASSWGRALLTFVLTAAMGFFAYNQKNQELDAAKDTVANAERQTVISEGNRITLDLQLEEKKKEVKNLQLQLIDATSGSNDAIRQLVTDPNATPMERRVRLQDAARKLRDGSKRQDTLAPFTQELPSGTAELARLLSGLLTRYPTTVDLGRVDLHGHFWRDAGLNNVLLKSSDLRAVDLSLASLVNATFEGAVMQCVNLEDAAVGKAAFGDADLSFSNLKGVDLTAVTGLTKEQLNGIDYDDETFFPPSVPPRDDLPPPVSYGDAPMCAKKHFGSVVVSEAQPVQPQGDTRTPAPSPSVTTKTRTPAPSPSATTKTG